jgi:hypothetical protein
MAEKEGEREEVRGMGNTTHEESPEFSANLDLEFCP